MSTEEEKYYRILKILRESKPEMKAKDEIIETVIRKIKVKEDKKIHAGNILEFFFSWVYIGWVRRSFITASVIIIGIFIYQQSIIIRQINSLENRAVFTDSRFVKGTSEDIEGKLFMYKLKGMKIEPRNIIISEKQFEKLLDSFNNLNEHYEDLLELIKEDPELKKMIETRLSEKNKEKFNL